ncbi:hypothetical protein ACFYOV_29780 [Streptomyces sp. NPDC005931]|uniref:hypothetical protein n=1 Tax=Streptomyces sp. NPDC005931 TaxID=3364737 RepID=UPI0036AAA59C
MMSRYTVALACAAALTVLMAGSAAAAPDDTEQAGPARTAVTAQAGNTYVLAPQDKPDLWLGDADYYGTVVCRASRLWYGGGRDDAIWRMSSNSDGSVSLLNMDAEQYGQSLRAAGDAILVSQGYGDAFHWYTVAGPSGSVALRNKVTGRYLAATAAGVVVSAAQAYWWYMVNTLP